MTGIRANSVQVDKLFRARCHLTPCGWTGTEHQSFADANAEREAHLAQHRAALDDAGPEVTPSLCGRCKTAPVARPGVTRPDGQPAARARWCDACLDRCHEATEFDHICQVCASPEEARARGWAVTR